MSTRLYTTQHTVAAGVTAAAPQVQAVTLEDATLDTVEIIIPDGHIGLTGIAIHAGGSPVIPFALGTFIVGNNDELTFPYNAEVGGNQLSVVTFNIGVYPHTFYIRWTISDTDSAAPLVIASPQQAAPASPVDIASILGISGVVA